MLNVNYRAAANLHADNLSEQELEQNELEWGLHSLPHGGAARTVELWGGIECTVNRVRDEYLDQMERNGHAHRMEDLELFAGLGVRALRYPVLWERTAPDGVESADWSWPDARLPRLQELGVRPIVGLVHHGSGPRYTSLADPQFPEKLAEYAGAVARRYPWIEAYTPVNEILTTARFSGLYGHWYPHGQDEQQFARVILNECRGTILAMRAIREVNPDAKLVQTDDLGKTFSTPELVYQAEFDNARRWLGWDLLCGRVDREHALWSFLQYSGVTEAELEWFLENPCPPDTLGVNYYITSERFLDHRLERYPEWTHGGNGRDSYADVETVRVSAQGIAGAEALVREAWERYRIPVAVTEAHLGCTREEQLRWLLEIWRGANRLRREGADVRAVTAWSLLGAFDWNSLLTENRGHYEPGVFDIRGGWPRPTALAKLMQELAAGREPSHPSLGQPGWWRRPERLQYPPVEIHGIHAAPREPGAGNPLRIGLPAVPRSAATGRDGRPVRPLLITGATGTLGRAFARLCEVRGLPFRLLRRADLDIAVPYSVEDALDEIQPWAVINTAGYVRVDDAEVEAERCMRENAKGPALLAAACARRGLPLVTFSSDLVFDGAKGEPYVESDAVAPVNVYGASKVRAERAVLDAHPGALVVRTSAFFGPWDEHNFVTIALRELAAGRTFTAADDTVISPTYVPDLVHGTLDLLIDGESGVWHLANQGAVTWLELAQQAASLAGIEPAGLVGQSTASLGLAAPRPSYGVLGSERGLMLPPLKDALTRYAQAVRFAARIATENPGRTDCLSASI